MTAVVLIAANVLAAGALAATEVGLLGSARPSPGPGPAVAASADPPLAMVSASTSSATYRLPPGPYELTVAATTPCWVEVTEAGRVQFAEVMPAGGSHSFAGAGRTTIELGSAGGSVTVSVGDRRERLHPPVAPYTLALVST